MVSQATQVTQGLLLRRVRPCPLPLPRPAAAAGVCCTPRRAHPLHRSSPFSAQPPLHSGRSCHVKKKTKKKQKKKTEAKELRGLKRDLQWNTLVYVLCGVVFVCRWWFCGVFKGEKRENNGLDWRGGESQSMHCNSEGFRLLVKAAENENRGVQHPPSGGEVGTAQWYVTDLIHRGTF